MNVKKNLYMFFLFIVIAFLFMIASPLHGLEEVKISAAVLEFTNNTGNSQYDYLEKAIPKTLTTELSKSKQLVIVEREKVDKILKEQELGMAGVTNASKIDSIGKILAADYIIYGDFTFLESKDNKKILINAHYTRIKTGAVQSEKAKGYLKFLDGHIELLSNNLRNKIAGESDYLESLKVGMPIGRYLLIGTGVSLITTGVLHYFFMNAREDYRNSTTLSSIDDNYKKTEIIYWTRNSFAGLTLVLGFITAASYIFDWGETGEILAFNPFTSDNDIAFSPGFNLQPVGNNDKMGYNISLFITKKF
jgi:TolB-like protein